MNSSKNNTLVELENIKTELEMDSLRVIKLQKELNQMLRQIETRANVTAQLPLKEEIQALKECISANQELLKSLSQQPFQSEKPSRLQSSFPTNLPKLPVLDVKPSSNRIFEVEDFIEAFEGRLEGTNIDQEFLSQIVLTTVPVDDLITTRWIRKNISNLPWMDAKQLLISHFDTPQIERKYYQEFLYNLEGKLLRNPI